MGYICGNTKDDDSNPSSGPFGPAGCSMIVIQMNGDNDRTISNAEVQPWSKNGYVAFTNTMYKAKTMAAAMTPPIQGVIEPYYTCVLNKKDAWISSLGLAYANTTVYTFIFISIIMWFTMIILNTFNRSNIKSIQATNVDTMQQNDLLTNEMISTIKQFQALKNDFKYGNFGIKYDVDEAVKKYHGNSNSNRITDVNDVEMFSSTSSSL
jgi:hypothetical protein